MSENIERASGENNILRPLAIRFLILLSVIQLFISFGQIVRDIGLSAVLVVNLGLFAMDVLALVFMIKANRRFYFFLVFNFCAEFLAVIYLISSGGSYGYWSFIWLGHYLLWILYFYFSKSASAYFGIVHQHWFTPLGSAPKPAPASSQTAMPVSGDDRHPARQKADEDFIFEQITHAMQTLLAIRDLGDEYEGDYKCLVAVHEDVSVIIALLMQVSLTISGDRHEDELLTLLRGYLPSIGLDDRHYMGIVDHYNRLHSLYTRLSPREYSRERELVNMAAKSLYNQGPNVNYELRTFLDMYGERYRESLRQHKAEKAQRKSISLRRWQFAGLISVLALAVAFAAYSQYRVTELEKAVQSYDQQVADLNRTIVDREASLSEYINKYMDSVQEISDSKRAATLARMDASQLKIENDFFNENIALIDLADNYYYHTYDCSYFKNARQYFAFNVEYARSLGYQPCQYCH